MVHKTFFSIEEDFITWREKFWPTVCEHFGVQATGDQVRYIKLSHIDQSLIYSISVNMTNIKKTLQFIGVLSSLKQFHTVFMNSFHIKNVNIKSTKA